MIVVAGWAYPPAMADPEPAAATAQNPEPGESMRGVGRFIAAVGVAVIVGSVIGGVHLITVKACGINPYDGSPDCQFATAHPDAGAGWAVLVGGIANGAVVLTVAWLCNVVAKHRDALTRILTASRAWRVDLVGVASRVLLPDPVPTWQKARRQ